MMKQTLVVLASLAAIAASDASLAVEAKHGGKVVETSGHHFIELVAGDGTLEVHVMHDDGNSENVADATGTATVLSGGKKEEIALVASGNVSLKGSGSFKRTPGTIIVVTLKMPGHKPEQARFKLD
jgi:hypothetical protein